MPGPGLFPVHGLRLKYSVAIRAEVAAGWIGQDAGKRGHRRAMWAGRNKPNLLAGERKIEQDHFY